MGIFALKLRWMTQYQEQNYIYLGQFIFVFCQVCLEHDHIILKKKKKNYRHKKNTEFHKHHDQCFVTIKNKCPYLSDSDTIYKVI